MEYDIKRGHHKEVEDEGLKNIMQRIFGNVRLENDLLVSEFGALDRVEAKILSKTSLYVATESNPDVSDEVANETIDKFNEFLYEATGFTSKKRRARLKKKAKEGKL